MALESVRFRVLGPVGAWVGQQPVPLGGPRPRAVLAVLLLARGRSVPVQRMVDAVWGEESPATATGRVHAIISGLRQALAKAGAAGEVIRTTPGGYLVDPAAGSVDVTEFRQLAEAGTQAAERGEHAAAVEQFAAALAMWTGRALEGLEGPFAEREAERWEGLRLDVIEAGAAARLELSGAPEAGLIHELTGLADANPQREGLVAALMTALHRAGRGPEALAAFRANQRWLRDELGLDAPKRLAALASAILRDEPGAGAPTAANRPARAVAAAPRPAQLPVGVLGFAGRDAELDGLDALLADPAPAASGTPVALIIGLAGVGKTELAVQWSQRAATRFPDGQLFVNLRGHARNPPREPAEVLGGFLRALGVPTQSVPVDQDEAAALYRSLLAERKVLVVLDNAVSPQQVYPLLPGGPGCRVLVTSRRRLGGLIARHGARSLAVGALEDVEALALLRRIVGDDRVEAEPEPARGIIERCAGLPLAVRIAATGLVGAPQLSLADFRDRLEKAGALRTLTVEGDEQGGLAAALDLSFQALTEPTRRLFSLFGFAGFEDFSAPSADALAGGDASAAVNELADAHLLTRIAGGRFALHDLVAEYAAQRSNSERSADEVGAAARRVPDWYVSATRAASIAIYPAASKAASGELAENEPEPPRFETHDDALAWFEAERGNVKAAVRLAAECGLHRHAVELPYLLVSYYDLSKRWDDWIATHEIAVRSAVALDDPGAQARALNYAGVAYQQLNKFGQARTHQQQALELCVRAGDTGLEAFVHSSLGVTRARGGDRRGALHQFERALALHRVQGNADGQTIALNNLAEAQTDLGLYTEALASLEEALVIATGLGNGFNTRVILCSLGVVHGLADRYAQAIESFRRAIEAGEATHDRFGVAETLSCLGDVLHRNGSTNEAHLSWKQAAELFDVINAEQAATLRERTSECCGAGFTPQVR